jgi:hypothetical protein
MRKVFLPKLLVMAFGVLSLMQSCKDDSYLLTPATVPSQSFSEGCDDPSGMISRGWKLINKSFPLGSGIWQSGGDATAPFFNPFSSNGSLAGFVGVGVNSTKTPVAADASPNALLAPTAPQGFINNFIVSPELIMKNGDKIVFYTRAQMIGGATATDSTDWANRLQVRINRSGSSLNVGDIKDYWTWLNTTTDVEAGDNPGDFDIVLLDINPNLHEWHKVVPGTSVVDGKAYSAATNNLAYPVQWTRFEVTVSGLDAPTKSRFAFRYYVPGGDPNNGYASGVGLDNIQYISN